MGVAVSQYRACIGCFNLLRLNFSRKPDPFCSFCSLQHLFTSLIIFCLFLSGDIEVNPGRGKETTVSVCHWNLNSVWVGESIKIKQLSAFLNSYKFDIVCLGETFLNSSINDDEPSYQCLRMTAKRNESFYHVDVEEF